MKNAIIPLLVAVLCGCAAHMVVAPGSESQSPYAPVNEAIRPGLIKYLNQGMQGVRDARREDAYKQMHDSCGGDYRIVQESPRSEGGSVVPVGNIAVYDESQYIYIQFECMAKR